MKHSRMRPVNLDSYMKWVKIELITAGCACGFVGGLWAVGVADWTLVLAVPVAIVILAEAARDQWMRR